MFKILSIAALALASAAPASAAVILFSSFDDITSPDFATQGYTIIPTADGWTGGARGIEIQNNGVAGAPHSSPNLVELDTTGNSSMFYNLGPGTYRVNYWYSPRPGNSANSNRIGLTIGGSELDVASALGGSNTMWQLRSVRFTTTGGDLTFDARGPSDGLGGYLDDITISTVPEPEVWGLMLAGFAMVGMSVRRRKVDIVSA